MGSSRQTQHQYRPGWAPVKFGEDETRPPRHRLNWRQIGLCMFALAIGIDGGLLIAAALHT